MAARGVYPPTPIPFFNLFFKGAFSGRTLLIPPGPTPTTQYTEFYCQSGGSNTNSGQDRNNTAKYTTTNGNWNSSTGVFIPSDGSNPGSSIQVGDFASVMNDGATVSVFIGRITGVVNAVNGSITVSTTAIAGNIPTTNATARTLIVGGAWKGPNAAVGWPLTATWSQAKNIAGNPPRINYLNDATYSITANIVVGADVMVHQGYSNIPGDGGRATIDGGSNAIVLLSGGNGVTMADFIFSNNGTTGSNTGVNMGQTQFIRCIFHDFRGNGLSFSGGVCVQCEWYNCNTSNSTSTGAISANVCDLWNCYIHDCTGTNNSGLVVPSGSNATHLYHTIFDTIGNNAIDWTSASNGGIFHVFNCDFYKITKDAIRFEAATPKSTVWVYSSNFVSIGNNCVNLGGQAASGWLANCGFGTGSMGIKGGILSSTLGMIVSQPVYYIPDTTPWNSPDTGDFSLVSASAIGAGFGSFIETGNSKTGTITQHNIGAAIPPHVTTTIQIGASLGGY